MNKGSSTITLNVNKQTKNKLKERYILHQYTLTYISSNTCVDIRVVDHFTDGKLFIYYLLTSLFD